MTRPSFAVAMIVAAAVGCGDGDGEDAGSDQEPDCLEEAGPLDCAATFGLQANGSIEPTYDELFSRLLQPTCGGSSACHDSTGQQGGLVFDTAEASYDRLVGPGSDGRPRVIPNDIECGKMIVRLSIHGESWSMPVGNPLDEAQLCTIRHWINNGAPR